MKLIQMKKSIVGAIFAFVLLFGGMSLMTTSAFAHDRGRYWQNRGGFIGNRYVYRSPRVFTYPRVYAAPRVFAYPRVYTYPRIYTYPRVYAFGYPYSYSYGYPYTYNYGASSYAYGEQRGYIDGLNRGREDARDGRSFNPNNSSHYRSGNAVYREAFRRGYQVGYSQYAGYGYRRW